MSIPAPALPGFGAGAQAKAENEQLRALAESRALGELKDRKLRIAIVQYGVLHERFEDLRSGGPETYYAQRYSVDFVADLAERHDFVGVCGVLGDAPGEKALSDNLYSACAPLVDGAVDSPAVISHLERWRPDRLILQAPVRPILKWAIANRIDTLPLLADSFEQTSLRHRYRAYRLARLLNNPAIRAVGNHNVPSCLSLKRIGVAPEKLFPWDWPHTLRPENHSPKALQTGEPAKLVFVGSLASAKGVGDCIEAGRILKSEGIPFSMTLIGGGDFSDEAQSMISEMGLSGVIHLAGRMAHDDVVKALGEATVSLAPSWHDYPEGLPMTIYEALATRTPLALSDHPMFQLYFKDTPAARMAPEKNPATLAAGIKALITSPDVYAKASQATEALWNRIKCDLTWGAFIAAWLGEDGQTLGDIENYNLANTLTRLR